ncbi:coproporphyrinogen dehydrogenase HemZ [Petroclostridium sp. X23]|uniref:coproporphyrinogen dehydrogenase HemZ n=1 Tax=Petroclostridium sp. X23 TaxID=3045146 RepID=UPI0024AE7ABB|nr:coproporphyrinogen dehydrogenase HemZ [Petroclostridium sp. X23]WHH59068.1 coproporphyrinogen dehydrogenase HemZ [Petroclostridium sp. X23]
MKILLRGHNYRYEIEQMVRIFFEQQKIEYIENKDEVENAEFNIISMLQESSSQIVAVTYIEYDGKNKEYKIEKQYDTELDEVEYVKLCKAIIKLSFFNAAKEVASVQVPWGTLTGIRPTKIVHHLMEQQKTDQEIKKILSERYAVTAQKIDLALEVAKNELKILKKSAPDAVAVYIGIPFCPTRCLYCSFVSNSVHRAQKLIEPYMDALIKEIEYTKTIIDKLNWKVESVYIGGGTPTVLAPEMMDRLLFTLFQQLDLTKVKEFTIEAGRPDTIDRQKLLTIRNYPVNRISINPQTMHKETLKTIGRCHSPEDIVRSFELARELGFSNINMDVIAGLPDETVEMYEDTLNRIQHMAPENITVHTMSIKRASRLNEKKDEYAITQAKAVHRMLDFTHRFMKDNTMLPYYMYRQKNILGNLENVGYCKPGYECIYNIQIMEERQSIIALGCGGVTKLVNQRENRIDRIFNVKDVEEYIQRIDEMLERKNKIYHYFA